jgi:hypothetical protein
LDVENYPCWHFDLTTISLAFVETRREKLKKKKRKGLLGCVSTREREREKERERERERELVNLLPGTVFTIGLGALEHVPAWEKVGKKLDEMPIRSSTIG